MNVTAVETRAWTKDDGTEVTTYWVTLEGREKNVPCYDAKAAALKMDAPLPEGWEIKVSKAGKDYLAPPRAPGFGGGGGGRREMSPSERSEIRAEVALKAAVEMAARHSPLQFVDQEVPEVLDVANRFYEWISEFSAGALSHLATSGTAGGTSSSPPRVTNPPAMTSATGGEHEGVLGGTPARELQPGGGQRGEGGAATADGEAPAVPPSLSGEEFFGKPCECGETIWKPAPVGGFSVCVGCLNAEKTKEVQLP